MIETLGKKQERFMLCVAQLVLYAAFCKYGIRGKELLRTAYQAKEYARLGKGILNSNHRNGLAIDIILSNKGKVVMEGIPYQKLANYWKTLYSDCCWGGDFKRRDVYHYSIKHKGVI